MQFDPAKVYWVQSAQDHTVLLALTPRLTQGYLVWFDTLRDRVMQGEVIDESSAHLIFRAQSGALYRFEVLTLEAYQLNIRGKVECAPFFASAHELHQHYLRTFRG